MNKDVIYIEPENDITDIISKIENSKQKIVALVPPKKAGVFRSVVNIKLINKSAVGANKTVVLVTTDPSIIKLAAATKLPVTKDLNSAPTIPSAEAEVGETAKEEVIEEKDDEDEKAGKEAREDEEDEKDNEEENEDGEVENEKNSIKKKPKKAKKDKKKSGNPVLAWIEEHKKLTIFSGAGAVLLVLLLVWMFAIAPAVTVIVDIKTTLNNFSESVTFANELSDENIEEGKFYLDEKKVEETSEIEFEATGTKNVGEKAHGEVVVYAYFPRKGTIAINAGSSFTLNGLTYVSEKDASLSWDEKSTSVCDNKDEPSSIVSGCLISGRVNVVATAPGSNYNIAPSNTGWNTTANVGVYSDSAMTGGTDETIKVVSQADIEKAKNEADASNEADNKEKLHEMISEDAMVIDSSFKQTTSDGVSIPAVGEEVKEGERATLKITTTAMVFVLDKAKIEEFIREKAKLGENQKIYEMKSPFIENFMKTDSGYAGKLKTSYAVGPKVTENDIIEIIKGKGIGDAQHALHDIDGVTAVKIDPKYPWVSSVPNDTNRITVNLEIKE